MIRLTDADPIGDPPGDGWRSVAMESMDDLHALSVLLRLGRHVRVEAPGEIRAQLLDDVDHIAALYRGGGGVLS